MFKLFFLAAFLFVAAWAEPEAKAQVLPVGVAPYNYQSAIYPGHMGAYPHLDAYKHLPYNYDATKYPYQHGAYPYAHSSAYAYGAKAYPYETGYPHQYGAYPYSALGHQYPYTGIYPGAHVMPKF